jgi:hypothetical protein
VTAGVYHYGNDAFPTATYRSSNYWVDLLFIPASAPATPDMGPIPPSNPDMTSTPPSPPDMSPTPPPTPDMTPTTPTNASCTKHATTANLTSTFSAANAGDVVCLATGSYGTFAPGMKGGMVTIQPESGASVTMAISINPATNITIDGIADITDAYFDDSRTKNITIRNSYFSGQTQFRTANIANANILFDHNVHGPWNTCSGCAEARVWLPERTSQPSGITIQNSKFGPGGNSDGIQNGSNGTRILNNEFVGLHQIDGASGVHVDSIQLYGSQNTVIRGNYFHDVADSVAAWDGADHEIVEDNVVVTDGYPYAMAVLSDNGSIVRHNTLAMFSASGSPCDYNLPCGVLYLGSKSGTPGGVGTTVDDNILAEIDVPEGSQSYAAEDYNLCENHKASGAHDLLGTPVFVGGARPSSYAGFELATGSNGIANASDGTNRGIP